MESMCNVSGLRDFVKFITGSIIFQGSSCSSLKISTFSNIICKSQTSAYVHMTTEVSLFECMRENNSATKADIEIRICLSLDN